MTEYVGSTSARPDLDWSQLKETILMLNLAVAQIDQSLNEGDASVSTLSSSFTALATNLSDIKSSVEHLHADDHQNDKMRTIIEGSAETGLDKVHTAIVAFQFYDKLTQRLDHVSQSLSDLSALIANPSALYSPTEWQKLQTSIRSKYTMEEERKMFDNVISGMPIEQALDIFRSEKQANQEDEDDIELF
ncbi:hypothetical protein [Thalassotalea sp. G2M2-11]|uniref:hypothetical protein n=1 Tax=Thalassotalea sp. G2M2-11 TaxID=2787627 RepID=UPI0019D1658C|nr:hypothetical protein [Thalassotalea sp. G2M2-11]